LKRLSFSYINKYLFKTFNNDELVKSRQIAMEKGPYANHDNAAYGTFYTAIKNEHQIPDDIS